VGPGSAAQRFTLHRVRDEEIVMDAVTKPKPAGPTVIDGLEFPFPDYPSPGGAIEVADGIFWISTPVPFVGLKQVNLWLVRDGDGFTMIDCSYNGDVQRELIRAVWANVLGGRPVTQLIVTHFHPDHAGGSGWIAEKWGLRPRMSEGEWLTAKLAEMNHNTDHVQSRALFYRRHGLDEGRVRRFLSGVTLYSDGVTLPKSHKRLRGGDLVAIGPDQWRVIIGEGHSPEHVSLYCAKRKILIAGDQILPSITTNVSTWHVEPEFDAVGAFLKTCKTFLDVLRPDTLILPSHRKPFRNVQHRLRQLAVHHAQRLNVILDAAGAETSAGELIDVMFTPGLDGHQVGFAMGEAVAHLNHLVTLGHMRMIETSDKVRYRRISPPDARVMPGFE
jgi:glyoxylase-like metal-dependent hydrolase (beta-lactamase superfamily II)